MGPLCGPQVSVIPRELQVRAGSGGRRSGGTLSYIVPAMTELRSVSAYSGRSTRDLVVAGQASTWVTRSVASRARASDGSRAAWVTMVAPTMRQRYIMVWNPPIQNRGIGVHSR